MIPPFSETLKPGDRVYIEPKDGYPFYAYVTEILDDGRYLFAIRPTTTHTLARHLKEQT